MFKHARRVIAVLVTLCLLFPAASGSAAPPAQAGSLDPVKVLLPFMSRAPEDSQPEVYVKSSHTYWSGSPSSPFFVVVGEVVNDTAANIGQIFVTATFYDEEDNVVYRTEDQYRGVPLIEVLTPGMTAPFRMIIDFPPGPEIFNYEYYEFEVTWTETEEDPILLEVLDSSLYHESGSFHVTGEARNQTGRTVINAEAVVTMYNQAGEVVGVSSGSLTPANLVSQAVGDFSVNFPAWFGAPDTNAVASYRVLVTGR